MLILIVSAPSRRQRRTAALTSSAPSATSPKESRCWCITEPSPRLPVAVISGDAASSRGPGARPALIQLRVTGSCRGRTPAAEKADVKPASSNRPAFNRPMSTPSSGGVSPGSVIAAISSKPVCA